MSQELHDIKETLKTQGALIDQLVAQKTESAASLAEEIKALILENNAKITASLAPIVPPQTPLPAS